MGRKEGNYTNTNDGRAGGRRSMAPLEGIIQKILKDLVQLQKPEISVFRFLRARTRVGASGRYMDHARRPCR